MVCYTETVGQRHDYINEKCREVEALTEDNILEGGSKGLVMRQEHVIAWCLVLGF